jgi:hypothetical protein
MPLRPWMRRLEHKANAHHSHILLADGSLYTYNWNRAAEQLWAYTIGLMRLPEPGESWPEEPEILTMIRRAKNPRLAISSFRPTNPEHALIDVGVLLEEDSGWPPDEPTEDLSETHEDAPESI